MKNCSNAGAAPRPTIQRHPFGCVEYSQPMMYATTCPPVMKRLLTVTSLPLDALGASSLMYMGTTKLALPTAAPTTLLPSIIPHTVVEKAWTSAPATNKTSAMSMMLRRPSASASTPVSGEASSAKKDVEDVMSDLSRVVRGRWERDVPIDMSVEEMTPVLYYTVSPTWSYRTDMKDCTYSYPNSNPLTPAHTVNVHKNHPGDTSALSSISTPSASSSLWRSSFGYSRVLGMSGCAAASVMLCSSTSSVSASVRLERALECSRSDGKVEREHGCVRWKRQRLG